MTNSTFNAIINTSLTFKKKVDGKMQSFTTTALEDGFKHIPKTADIAEEAAKKAVRDLEKVYDYLTEAGTCRADGQRNKAVNKAYDFARSYLKAVGLDSGVGNIAMVTAVLAPKRQTVKGDVKGGYTTKATFVKYVLYLTNHVIETGSWVDPKKSPKSSKDDNAELWAQMERNKKALQAEQEKAQIMSVIISQSPELQAQLQEMLAKLSA